MSDFTPDFHDFGGAIYVNCAFHGPMPRRATEAVERALELKENPSRIRDQDHFAFPDAYRDAVAELIGADSQDIAVTDSATQGTMILVSGLDWRPGDEVVIPAAEFPSNRFPWRSLEARGVRVHEVEMASTEQTIENLSRIVGGRTRVVSLSWVNYSTGIKLDLPSIANLCHERDVLLAVDGSQGIGGLGFSVDAAAVDVLMCAGYKWMLGPYGTGFAWVRPELVEQLAISNVNWFSLAGASDFNRLSQCDLTFVPGARRFDRNEPGAFLNMAGAAASCRYLLDVGVDTIERHNQALLDRLVSGLGPGMRSLAPPQRDRRSNILCVATESAEQGDAAFERLVAHDIFVSRREGAIRFSPHIYNTENQIDRVLEVLNDHRSRPSRTTHLPRGERLEVTTPAELPGHEPLEGRHVRLRDIRSEDDARDLYADSHQPPVDGVDSSAALWAYLHIGPFESQAALQRHFEEGSRSETKRTLTVEHLASGRAVGSVSFMRIQPAMRTVELGSIWYLPEFQRTEVNTETIYLMLGESFDRLGYRRVEWKCDALNIPSRRAALRLGFGFEGLFRQHMIIKGHSRDTAWYAMLDRDWPTIKANFERWLYGNETPRPSLTELNRK